MSPLLQRTLEEKTLSRTRLMALPFPEKVRIVKKMRAAAENRLVLREEPPAYGSSKP
jgi:hypothetical protein